LLGRSDLTEELVPLSHNLSQVADIGLKALDDLHGHHLVGAEARKGTVDFLKSSEKPQSVVLLMVVPPVELLVQATITPEM
jgi:hexosaminidase